MVAPGAVAEYERDRTVAYDLVVGAPAVVLDETGVALEGSHGTVSLAANRAARPRRPDRPEPSTRGRPDRRLRPWPTSSSTG